MAQATHQTPPHSGSRFEPNAPGDDAGSRGGLQLSAADVRNLRIFGKLMDNAVELPGVNQKVGLDALIGVLPVAGDGVSFMISLYPLVVAYRAGAGPALLLKMGGNLLLDFLVGLIPVLGDLFDVAFKANVRNLRLLGIELDDR